MSIESFESSPESISEPVLPLSEPIEAKTPTRVIRRPYLGNKKSRLLRAQVQLKDPDVLNDPDALVIIDRPDTRLNKKRYPIIPRLTAPRTRKVPFSEMSADAQLAFMNLMHAKGQLPEILIYAHVLPEGITHAELDEAHVNIKLADVEALKAKALAKILAFEAKRQ